MLLFGADRVAEFSHYFQGRVALLTTPTGRTRGNESTISVLQQCCDLRLLLAPEHGVRGDKPAGALFTDEIDEWIISAIKKLGYDTAKAVLNVPREVLIEKADLEEDTVDHVLSVLRAEFEDEQEAND